MRHRSALQRRGSQAKHAAEDVAGVGHGAHGRVGDRVKGGELGGHGGAVEADEGALVAHLVAVVGRREHRDAVAVVVHLIPLVLHLMPKAYNVRYRAISCNLICWDLC